MKIATFNPMILSKNAEEIISLFEELGFERRHQVDNIDGKDISSVRMMDANGFYLDVASVESLPRDMTTMRMNVSDFDEAYEFLKNYISQNNTTSESGELEGCAAIRLMKRYFDLNLYGAILKANNKIVSLSIGEKMGDTLFVHVEKGLIEFSGVYQVMVQKFAETYAGDVLFINREEDDGVEGLRKSKLSYHPIGLLNKYSVEIT